MYRAMEEKNDVVYDDRKMFLKKRAFEIVADQTGKIFDPNVLTIVWARRFAGYKRADMLTYDMERFEKMLNNTKHPVQIIWAGKPYPVDYPAISQFNNLVHLSKKYKNVAVLVGYGWIPEFINHGNNGFVVPKADYDNMSQHDQDEYDLNKAYEILEQQIIPMYYEDHDTWRQIMKNGMMDVRFQFDSNRMAHEYYEIMYK